VSNATYDLLSMGEAALVTSGTATLETALFKVPQVVCYKSSWLSYQIGKRVVKLDFISLVNLIMAREVVCELIQNDLNTQRLTKNSKTSSAAQHNNASWPIISVWKTNWAAVAPVKKWPD
jgi:lipid-A-disaccharide synthase